MKLFGVSAETDGVDKGYVGGKEPETLIASCHKCQQAFMPGDFGWCESPTKFIHYWCWVAGRWPAEVMKQLDYFRYLQTQVGYDKACEVYLHNGWELPEEITKEKENAT